MKIDATNMYSESFAMAVCLPQACAGAWSAVRMSVTRFSKSEPAVTSLWVRVARLDDGAAVGAAHDACPDPLVRDHEADHEAGEQEERADPDQGDARIARHVEAGELALALEGHGQVADLRRLALVDHLGVREGALPAGVDADPDLAGLDLGVRAPARPGDLGVVARAGDGEDPELATLLRLVGERHARRLQDDVPVLVLDGHGGGGAEERLVERQAVVAERVVDPDGLALRPPGRP